MKGKLFVLQVIQEQYEGNASTTCQESKYICKEVVAPTLISYSTFFWGI